LVEISNETGANIVYDLLLWKPPDRYSILISIGLGFSMIDDFLLSSSILLQLGGFSAGSFCLHLSIYIRYKNLIHLPWDTFIKSMELHFCQSTSSVT
jgi:hypothetical protein